MVPADWLVHRRVRGWEVRGQRWSNGSADC